MRVIAVDDEPISLDYLKLILEDTPEIDEVEIFLNGKEALTWLKNHDTDIAFLDIQMSGMDGLELAEKIISLHSNTKIVFVTGSKDYAIEAFKIHAAGYLVKPATVENVRKEILHIKDIMPKSVKKPVRIQCFGNFEVFCNENPVKFRYRKTKELLAYLVHRRGAAISVRELVALLYADRPDSDSLQSQLRTLVSDLSKAFSDLGVDNLLVRQRGMLAVLPDAFECDYYDYLNGDQLAGKTYLGEYMAQYDWAEYTAGYLERKKD